MQPRVDPTDPDTVYTMSQNGAIVRLDRQTGKSTPIRPRSSGKDAVRWNWDTPFIVSPHNSKRLYLAGSKLFKSDDRGDNWKAVSPDLTRQADPNKAEVMGKVWGPRRSRKYIHHPAQHRHRAWRSPPQGGFTPRRHRRWPRAGQRGWRRELAEDRIVPGVPSGTTWVSDLCAPPTMPKPSTRPSTTGSGDFTPYLLRSHDRGRSWESISGNLPDRHCVWCVVEDHANRDLLFAGTEFGLFATVNGGITWTRSPAR